MAVENYGKIKEGKRRKLKKRIISAVIIVLVIVAGAGVIGTLTSDSDEYRERVSILEENHRLREENEQLKEQVAALEGQLNEKDALIAAMPAETLAPDASAESQIPAVTDAPADAASPRS